MAKVNKKIEKAIEQENVGADIQNIKGDLKSLQENVSQLAQDTKSYGSVRASELGEAAKQKAAQLRSKGKDQLRSAEAQVRQNPIQSIAIAFGTGLLISALFGRRS